MSIHHTYNRGARVTILNTMGNGRFVIEGKATIIATCDADEAYMVQFDGENERYQRWIDVAAQDDPEAWVKQMNAGRS